MRHGWGSRSESKPRIISLRICIIWASVLPDLQGGLFTSDWQMPRKAFTMKQYVQTDLEADRQVADMLAELIVGGTLIATEITGRAARDGRR